MRLRKFSESILSKREDWNYEEILRDLNRVSPFSAVLWKGWGAPPERLIGREQSYHGGGRVIKIENDRGEINFRGSSLGLGLGSITKKLNMGTAPVFTTRSYIHAMFFGNPYAFIPAASYVTAHNPDVFDLISIKDPEKIDEFIKNYTFYNNKMPPTDAKDEVIVSTTKYWLVSISSLIYDTKGQLKTYKKAEEVVAYQDLKEVIVNYLKYTEWVIYKNIQSALDPEARLKEYERMGYPKEWVGRWERKLSKKQMS
jgi:hypothetical protein